MFQRKVRVPVKLILCFSVSCFLETGVVFGWDNYGISCFNKRFHVPEDAKLCSGGTNFVFQRDVSCSAEIHFAFPGVPVKLIPCFGLIGSVFQRKVSWSGGTNIVFRWD